MTASVDDADILLVEDNPDDAELTIRALRSQNLANQLIWVKNGAEALDFVFQRGAFAQRTGANPRVILLDLSLPKINGIEVLRQLKGEARTKRIPVVILSSSTHDKDVVGSYDLGVNSYVAKPVQFEEFVKVVSELGLYWLLINHPPRHP